MPRTKKTPAEAPAPVQEAAAPARTAKKAAPAKKAAAARKAPEAAVERVEELYLQVAGGEWNVSDCKERAAAAYAAAGNEVSGIRKLTVYLKPEEGRLYYVVNDEATGSIDL